MSEARKIEVLLAAYNGAPYIREQLDSILGQTDQRWHLTLSDDGSTDGTADVLDEYARRYPERITRVVAGRRFGSAKAHFMWLISRCDAEWIVLSDQDDVIFPQKLEKLAALMEQTEAQAGRGAPALVFSDQTPTDARLRPLCDSLMRMQKQYAEEIDWRALIFQNVVTGGACMFNQALARLACRCSDVSQIAMHDWWLAIVAARFGRVAYLDESTGYYRQHGGNCVGAKRFGSMAYVAGTLYRPTRLRATIQAKKRQARAFERTYAPHLSEEELRFLETFGRARSGVGFYLAHGNLIHGACRLAGLLLLG